MSQGKISLALAFIKTHPLDVARALEQHDLENVVEFIANIPPAYASPVISGMLSHKAASICKQIDAVKAASILMHLNSGQVVAILRHVDKDVRGAIIQELPAKVEVRCALLLNYSTEMVGAWMTPHILTVPFECTVAEAMPYIKNGDAHVYANYVFAVEADGTLKGRIELSKLLGAGPNTYLSALTEECRVTMWSRSLMHALSQNNDWNDEDAFPVLNSRSELIGVLRHVDLRKYLSESSARLIDSNSPDVPLAGFFKIYGHCLKTLFGSMKHCIGADFRS
jgi:Mg/Co/Ni transporter MgtE